MFIGRETELKFLNDKYSENGGQLIVLYGRRRVGKILFSYLLASSALPRERAAFFYHLALVSTTLPAMYKWSNSSPRMIKSS